VRGRIKGRRRRISYAAFAWLAAPYTLGFSAGIGGDIGGSGKTGRALNLSETLGLTPRQ